MSPLIDIMTDPQYRIYEKISEIIDKLKDIPSHEVAYLLMETFDIKEKEKEDLNKK